jgi:hypothetical protein
MITISFRFLVELLFAPRLLWIISTYSHAHRVV